MVICFKNLCASIIDTCINNTQSFTIKPYEIKTVVCENLKNMAISICLRKESSAKGSIYNLVLESQYIFYAEGENIEFSITREKIRVSLNVSYERVFIDSVQTHLVSETTKVKNETDIKRRYNRDQFRKLLYGPLEHFPGLCIIVCIIGILLAWLIDWRLIFAYYPCAYICLFGLHLFIDVIWKRFIKKAFKINEKEDFYQHFNVDYISQYYSQVDREPFMGTVDHK